MSATQLSINDIMEDMVLVYGKSEKYNLGCHGDGWVKKAEMALHYPLARNTFFTHYARVQDFLSQTKEGAAVFCRLSSDWEEQVYAFDDTPSLNWEIVSGVMRDAIRVQDMLSNMEGHLRGGVRFTAYPGVCRDLREITREVRNTTQRLGTILSKIQCPEEVSA